MKIGDIEIRDDWEECLYEWADEGKNKLVWMRDLKLNKTKVGLLLKMSPEFSDAWDRAKVLHDARWVEFLRVNLMNKRDFNTYGWTTYMRNNCGYNDKPNTDESGKGVLKDKTEKQTIISKYSNKKRLEVVQ